MLALDKTFYLKHDSLKELIDWNSYGNHQSHHAVIFVKLACEKEQLEN